MLSRANALVGVGRVKDAQDLLARIGADADPRRDALVRAQAAMLAARIASRRGDYAAAVGEIAGALVPTLREADPIAWTLALSLQAQILRSQGKLAEAADATGHLSAWAKGAGDDWRTLHAGLAEAEQAWAEHRREPALEQFAAAMREAGQFNVPVDLVAVGTPYLGALIDASQLDTARAVSGRIALWAERDPAAATAQAHLFRALGQDDAARAAEETAARLAAGYATAAVEPRH